MAWWKNQSSAKKWTKCSTAKQKGIHGVHERNHTKGINAINNFTAQQV